VGFDRKRHWEGIWGQRSPPEVSWYQQEPTLSLELIRASRVATDAPLIDVGGGASTLADRLLTAGYSDVSVLDLSRNALRHAERRLGPLASRVEWVEADITAFRPARRYALWHDRAVFHFLTDPKDRVAYRRVLD